MPPTREPISEETRKVMEIVQHDHDLLLYVVNRLGVEGHAELAAAIEFAVPAPRYEPPDGDLGFSAIFDEGRLNGAIMIGMRMLRIPDYKQLLEQFERDKVKS